MNNSINRMKELMNDETWWIHHMIVMESWWNQWLFNERMMMMMFPNIDIQMNLRMTQKHSIMNRSMIQLLESNDEWNQSMIDDSMLPFSITIFDSFESSMNGMTTNWNDDEIDESMFESNQSFKRNVQFKWNHLTGDLQTKRKRTVQQKKSNIDRSEWPNQRNQIKWSLPRKKISNVMNRIDSINRWMMDWTGRMDSNRMNDHHSMNNDRSIIIRRPKQIRISIMTSRWFDDQIPWNQSMNQKMMNFDPSMNRSNGRWFERNRADSRYWFDDWMNPGDKSFDESIGIESPNGNSNDSSNRNRIRWWKWFIDESTLNEWFDDDMEYSNDGINRLE